MLRCEARWSGLPEHFGKYKSAHRRLERWAHSGKAHQYLMIDSTLVRADQQAATGRKKGADNAPMHTQGGLTTKVY